MGFRFLRLARDLRNGVPKAEAERGKLVFSGVDLQFNGAGIIEDSLIFSCGCLTEGSSGLVSSPPGEFIMANSKSALKRVRQAVRRTDRNKTLRTRVKSLRKKTLEAAEAGNAEEAQNGMKQLASAVDRATLKGLYHKNKGANIKSKTVKAIKAAAGSGS